MSYEQNEASYYAAVQPVNNHKERLRSLFFGYIAGVVQKMVPFIAHVKKKL